jgi:cell division protease FtsH
MQSRNRRRQRPGQLAQGRGSDPTSPAPREGGRWERPGALAAYFALGLLALWAWQESFKSLSDREIPYSEFRAALQRGDVLEVRIAEQFIEGRLATSAPPEPRPADAQPVPLPKDAPRADAERESVRFRTARVEDPRLVEELAARHVEFSGVQPSLLREFLLSWLVPIGLIAVFWGLLARRMTGAGASLMSFGRSRARLVAESEPGVRFADVAGCDEAKLELQEIVDFLQRPERYRALGAKIPKGVLLVGPPGTGKTLIARAVAGEAGVPFFSLSGSEFVEMFVGVGAARVRDLFEQAQRSAPCLVFIDELDAIGRQRGVALGPANDEREQTLNQLLVELDGFEANAGVILLSATNRPDVLDRALLRPGRFDRHVLIDSPDAEGREAILRVHARAKPLDPDVDLNGIARATPGLSGADLANVMNEAALLAARAGARSIAQSHVEAALEKVVAGPERRSRRLSAQDKRRVAYHEVGHALVASLSRFADPVHKISIIPRGRAALGFTLQLPEEQQLLMTRAELLERIRVLLGGRAAESVAFEDVSTGAADDLERATALARQLVAIHGMGRSVGLVHSARPRSPAGLGVAESGLERDCSEATAREIDQEVRQILDDGFAAARKLLSDHRDALETAAAELERRETLDGTRFRELIGKSAPPGRAPRPS